MSNLPYILLTALFGGSTAAYAQGKKLRDYALLSLTNPPPYTTSGPSVSMVIPTLREEDYIEDILISIRNQTYTPVEIVISDSSPEEYKEPLLEIASMYGAKVVDTPKKNVSYGRNVGAAAASGEILIFCDADCILCHYFIEKLVGHLMEGAVLAHGVDTYCEASVLPITVRGVWSATKPSWYTTGRGIAIRAGDFWEIGGYDESCDPMEGCREDKDLGRRVIINYGKGSIVLDRGAVVAEAFRRPLSLDPRSLWPERGWRKGEVITRKPTLTYRYLV